VKVLIVEDVQPTADRLREILSAITGVEVVAVVATEDQALAACENNAIDFATIDLQLAQGSGFPVIRRLRSSKRPTCVVVLTNHAVPALKVASFEAGADYFLDKARDFNTVPALALEVLRVMNEREQVDQEGPAP
jgi:DNA-binding response OmpR family regulator